MKYLLRWIIIKLRQKRVDKMTREQMLKRLEKIDGDKEFYSWSTYDQNYLLRPTLKKEEECWYDRGFIIRRHRTYKWTMILGTIFWVLSGFLIPFIIGCIMSEPPLSTFHWKSLTDFPHRPLIDLNKYYWIADGAYYVLVSIYVTHGLIVPIGIVLGCIFPMVYQKIYFWVPKSRIDPNKSMFALDNYQLDLRGYYPNIAKGLGIFGMEKRNSAAIIGGSILGRFKK